MSELKDAAVAFASAGWRVFRIMPGSKIPRDRWVHGNAHNKATSDPTEVARRWAEEPGCNIGFATGGGVAVLDIDPQHGGKVPSWAPKTLCASTPSGGVHLYYKVDGPVSNSAGVLGPGVDVRGDGGMVLLPPSTIYDGAPGHNPGYYRWTYENEINGHTHPIAKLDVALLTARRPDGQYSARASKLANRRFGEGDRHQAMLTLAGKIRSVGGEKPEILAALTALNQTRFDPALGQEWVEKLADSIMKYDPDHDLIR